MSIFIAAIGYKIIKTGEQSWIGIVLAINL